jgi:hypothetical protein
MSEIFSAVPAEMDTFSAAHHAAGEAHVIAGSADHAAAATAIGPIGAAHFLPAYVTAQANCLHSALQVGHVHHAIGHATTASKAAIVAADNA